MVGGGRSLGSCVGLLCKRNPNPDLPKPHNPPQDSRSNPQNPIDAHTDASETNEKSLEIRPLNAMLMDSGMGFLFTASLRSDVKVGDVFEVKDCFCAEAMLAFNNDGPEYLAEGLDALADGNSGLE